jgi:hypothetical protein
MTIVLDSGAVIASERNDARFAALLAAARKKRVSMLLPATVVAETWRGPSTHPRAARLLGSIDGFPELNLSASKSGGAPCALGNGRYRRRQCRRHRDCNAPVDDRHVGPR